MLMFSDHEICSVVKLNATENPSPKFTGIFPQSQCKGLVKRSLLYAPVFVDIPIRNQKQRACVLVVIMLGTNWKTHVLSNPPVDELHSQHMPRIAGTQISWSIPRVLWIKTYHPRLETQKKFHIHRMFICSSPPNIWDVYLKTTHHIWDLSCPKKIHI